VNPLSPDIKTGQIQGGVASKKATICYYFLDEKSEKSERHEGSDKFEHLPKGGGGATPSALPLDLPLKNAIHQTTYSAYAYSSYHTFLMELVRRICLFNIKTSYPW